METGFRDLDDIITIDDKLILVAGRTGMGKTRLVTNIVTNIAIKQNIPVLFFSLEESKKTITNRILADENIIGITKIKDNDLTEEERKRIQETKEVLEKTPLYIDDTPCLTIEEISQKARTMKLEKDIKLVVIDDLELLNNQNNISDMGKKLEKIANELDLAIIVVSQMPKKIDRREDKRPKITDLKQGFTNVFDVIMFLYRDDHYNKYSEYYRILEVNVARNRTGNCSIVELVALDEYSKFGTLAK